MCLCAKFPTSYTGGYRNAQARLLALYFRSAITTLSHILHRASIPSFCLHFGVYLPSDWAAFLVFTSYSVSVAKFGFIDCAIERKKLPWIDKVGQYSPPCVSCDLSPRFSDRIAALATPLDCIADSRPLIRPVVSEASFIPVICSRCLLGEVLLSINPNAALT